MRKTILIFLLLIFSFGCSSRDSLKQMFITKNGECWVVHSQDHPNYTFWSFNEDMTADNLNRDKSGSLKKFNIDEDLIIGPKKWSISSDSILTWGMHKYDVVTANENAIVLMSEAEETNKQWYLFLIKESKKSMRKGAYYYEQKRFKNRKKYKSY